MTTEPRWPKPKWLQRSDDAINGAFARIPPIVGDILQPLIWFGMGYWVALHGWTG